MGHLRGSGRQKTRCPECLAAIWLKEDTEVWSPITCPECHTTLEIVSTHPLVLDYLAAGETDEWWDEDEEDEA